MTDYSSLINAIEANPLPFFLLTIWSLYWKGRALWRSAQLSQRNWFIALLVLNTFGLLEIFYIYRIGNNYDVQVVEK